MIVDQVIRHGALWKRVGFPGQLMIGERTVREGAHTRAGFRSLTDDFAAFVSAQTEVMRKKRRHVQAGQVERLLCVGVCLCRKIPSVSRTGRAAESQAPNQSSKTIRSRCCATTSSCWASRVEKHHRGRPLPHPKQSRRGRGGDRECI